MRAAPCRAAPGPAALAVSAAGGAPTRLRGGAGSEEGGVTAADAFKAAIAPHTSIMEGKAGEALASLDAVSSVFPRGRYDLSLFPGFMDMEGQNHQFKIRCAAPRSRVFARAERARVHSRASPTGGACAGARAVGPEPSCESSARWRSRAARHGGPARVRGVRWPQVRQHWARQHAAAWSGRSKCSTRPLRHARAVRRYANIERIYTLPRPQPAGSLVIVHLETAIRRGQTYYEWLAFFFDDKAHVDLDLNASQEARARPVRA